MKRKRKIFLVCLGMIFINTILCLSVILGSGNKNNQKRRQKTIGALYMTMNNPYFEVIHKEVETVVQQNGDCIITRDSCLDGDMQIRQIEYFIDRKVDSILLNVVDWRTVTPALEKAKKAGIPVFAVDAEVYDAEYVTGMLTSDNRQAGVIAAKDMMKRLPQGGNVLLLVQLNNKSAQDRIEGFLTTVKEANWPIHIVDELDCSGQLEIAQPLVEEILDRGEKIDAVMALNDPSALGAMAALDAAGILDQVLVYGVDGAPEAKSMIADGKMTATIAQSPTKTGKMAVQFLYDIMDGKKVKKKTILPVFLITEENIDDYNTSSWE